MKQFCKEFVSYEELLQAYHDCRKRKRRTINALEFEINDAEKLYNLWIELNTKTYSIGKSITFCVDKPVKREVFAADFRDRIVHHLIINRTEKYFEQEFIEDSYSCRKKKGTLYGVKKCAEYIKEYSQDYTIPTYIVKCDLKSFFMTINKYMLCDKLTDFMVKYYEGSSKDLSYTISLIRKIIFNRPQDNCIRKQPISSWQGLPKEKSLFSCAPNLGLPIGNLTSQIFANFFLSEFDKFVLDTLKIKYYGRYVDDFFFLVHDPETITPILKKCREKLKSMGVTLHPKKLYIQEVKKGVSFIGSVIKPNRLYIANRTKGNFWAALRKYSILLDDLAHQGLSPTPEQIAKFVSSVNSYLGFLKHYASFNIKRKLLSSNFMSGWYLYCYVDRKFRKIIPYREYSVYTYQKKKTYTREFIMNSAYCEDALITRELYKRSLQRRRPPIDFFN